MTNVKCNKKKMAEVSSTTITKMHEVQGIQQTMLVYRPENTYTTVSVHNC